MSYGQQVRPGQRVRPTGWATDWVTGLVHQVLMGIKTNTRPDPLD